LFGKYTIADAMYAPVVIRFHGYDVKLPPVARQYVETTLANPFIQEWMEAGKRESEIIEQDEA